MADRDALIAVPNIGEVTADKIISYRQTVGVIHDMDSLLEINGIGEKTVDLLKEYFYISDIYTTVTTTTASVTTTPTKTDASSATATKAKAGKTSTTSAVTTIATGISIPQRRPVNINTADVAELEKCLLITEEQARDIVTLREKIGGEYLNILEVLYCQSISPNLYAELEPYMMV